MLNLLSSFSIPFFLLVDTQFKEKWETLETRSLDVDADDCK